MVEYNPTVDEIEEMCKSFRDGWDEVTRHTRLVYKGNKDYIPWAVPGYTVRNLNSVIEEHNISYHGGGVHFP